jgi:hypothetical protein
METEEVDKIVIKIISRLEKYEKFTDVSNIRHLLERYFKTYDVYTKAFLMTRIFYKLQTIQRKFPMIDFSEEPPKINDVSGKIKIGNVLLNKVPYLDFKLSKKDLNKNILVAASVGHGKTSLIYKVLSSLKEENLTFILFDLKRDYKSLAIEENTIYFNEDNLKINPLLPPSNVPIREWMVHFADAFSHSFSLLVGSRDFLLDSLNKFYDSLEKKELFSLPDFLSYLEKSQVRNEYIKIVKGRIASVLSATKIFNCREGISLSELDKFNVIFGIDNIGVPEQVFLFSIVLSSVFYMNLNDSSKRNNLYKMIVVDDAHTLLDINKEKDYAMGVPLAHQLIAKMRELGVGFIFSDQQISSLISSVIQNTNTKFIGRINLVEDLNRVFGSLVNKELLSTVSSLDVGEFLVISTKVSPFCIIKSEPIRIEKEIPQAVLDGKQRFYTNIFRDLNEVDKTIKFLIEEINENESANLSIHVQNIKEFISQEDFLSLKNKLISEGVLGEVSLEVSQGRPSRFLYLKESAKEKIRTLSKGLEVDALSFYNNDTFVKRILKDIVLQKLKKQGVKFSQDENGILLIGLIKIYITFMDSGENLSKILETSFDEVINIVDDTTQEKDVYARLIELGNPNALANMRVLKICKIKEFAI